ncbi:DUF1772 domain-containing protein [soil metagenome]|jgi:hypothetical protein
MTATPSTRVRFSLILILIVRFSLIFLAGMVAGAVYCVWLFEYLFMGNAHLYTELKQIQIQTLSTPLPTLGAAAILVALIKLYLSRRKRLVFWFTLAGAVLLVAAALLTAWGHFPLNDQIMTWSPEAPPAEWEQVRDRWRQTHLARTVVTALGFACFLLGEIFQRQMRLRREVDAGNVLAGR